MISHNKIVKDVFYKKSGRSKDLKVGDLIQHLKSKKRGRVKTLNGSIVVMECISQRKIRTCRGKLIYPVILTHQDNIRSMPEY